MIFYIIITYIIGLVIAYYAWREGYTITVMDVLMFFTCPVLVPVVAVIHFCFSLNEWGKKPLLKGKDKDGSAT